MIPQVAAVTSTDNWRIKNKGISGHGVCSHRVCGVVCGVVAVDHSSLNW